MKKSLILVGMLVIGYANAQEGVVGINTDEPKATLDIQPNATNLTGTTNEGIIAPRLSKTRIANIEASKLTEGTLVYATDDTTSPISAYTGNDVKVAKITEKGYYFYNGTEWVKAGQGQNQSKFPWIYNTDGNVELNHQNANYKAIYTDKKYTFKNFDGSYEYYSAVTDNGRTVVNDSVSENSASSSQVKASKLHITNPDANFARNGEFIIGADNDTPDNVKVVQGLVGNAFTDAGNTKDYTTITGVHSMSSHNGSGTVTTLNGGVAISSTLPLSKVTNQYGFNTQASQLSDSDSQKVVGVRGFATQRGAGVIANLTGVEGEVDARLTTSTGNITNASGVLANLNFSTNRYTGSIENLAGVKITQTIAGGALSDRITNNYGLYVGDVIRGVNPYSIYTEAGRIRFGNLVGTGTRLVAVDENGVLTTGDAAISSKWVNDNANTLVKLAKLSNGTTDRTDARNLFITDVGSVGIGTPNPEVSLHIKKGAAHIQMDRYSENRNGTGIIALKARGTMDAPTAVQATDHLFSIVAGGHNGVELVKNKAGFYITASENWTDTANGTMMLFNTTDNGTTNVTEKMRITSEGNVGVGTSNPQMKLAVGSNYTGVDFIENDGLYLVSKGTSLLNTGIRSAGSVEISSDDNNNYSPSLGRFEGITFKTSAVERMAITETGKVRVSDLADTSATADRAVVVDKDGVLKVGASTATNGVQNTTNMKCEEATRGVMNFVKDVTIGSGTGDAFAVCLKGTDGNFYWRYLYGAGGVTNLQGDFGTGLQ